MPQRIVALLLWLLVSVLEADAVHAQDDTPTRCALQTVGPSRFIRLDTRQKRFFLTLPSVDRDSVQSVITALDICLAKHEWSRVWSLSVFADRRLARYKDDPQLVPKHKRQQWEHNYLAEYDRTTQIMTLNPVTKPTRYHFVP